MKDTLFLLCKLINFRQCLPFDAAVTGWGARKLCAEFVTPFMRTDLKM